MTARSFSDFDDYIQHVEDADLSCLMPRLETPHWELEQFASGQCHIQVASEGGGTLAEGAGNPEGLILFLQKTGTRAIANTRRLEDDALFLIRPGAEFCLSFEDSHDWMSVFVPTPIVSPQTHHALQLNRQTAETLHMGNRAGAQLQTLVDSYTGAIRDEPAVTTQSACGESFTESVLTIVDSLRDNCRESRACESTRGIPREVVVKRCQNFLEDPQNLPTVAQLATSVGVSERTLRTAFTECLGITPRKYLQLRRLHCARRLLRLHDENEVTVSEVATMVGIWDFGRFAQYYRQLFGEFPSTTLSGASSVSPI